MSKNTAVVHLKLKLNDDTVSSLRINAIKARYLPNGNVYEREYQVANTLVTHIGMAAAALTVIVPQGKIDLNFTIGTATFSFTDVMTPVVLPGSITSVSMQASNSGDTVTAYVFQGS